MSHFKIGTVLHIEGMKAQVIGYIVYRNPEDGNKHWTEYRLNTAEGECWLSWDEEYGEYSISWPSDLDDGTIGNEWQKVDEGTQIVQFCKGDVDVQVGDCASFAEYEDEAQEEILSLEMWEDGTEISEGYYLDEDEVEVGEVRKVKGGSNKYFYIVLGFILTIQLLSPLSLMVLRYLDSRVSIEDHMKNNINYIYVTSITGKENQKANVYRYIDYDRQRVTTDIVTKDIITGIHGNTELITANGEDASDGSISIVTKKEYCLIYYPEGENEVYIQVSNRKYNYTSDNTPYHARDATSRWYRQHYYSSAFQNDSSKWKHVPSAYRMYDGPIVQDLGNGYYDIYANTIRESRFSDRHSDSGGLSSGK